MQPINFSFENQFLPCECCKLKYTTSTTTATNGFKWTKKEIEREIIFFSKKLSKSKWYERVEIRRRLKHWTEKLERLEDYKQEFN